MGVFYDGNKHCINAVFERVLYCFVSYVGDVLEDRFTQSCLAWALDQPIVLMMVIGAILTYGIRDICPDLALVVYLKSSLIELTGAYF